LRRDRLLSCLVLACLLLVSILAEARVYRWTDSRGVEHFSNRIEEAPPAVRETLETVASESPSRLNVIPGLSSAGRVGGSGAEASRLPSFSPLPDRAALEWVDQVRGPVLLFTAAASFVLLGILLALLTLALLVACRMVGQEPPVFRKAYGIVVVQFLAGLAMGPGMVVVLGEPEVTTLGEGLRLQALQAGVLLLVNAGVLRALLCDSFPRSLGLALVATLVLLALAFLLGLGVVCAGGVFALGG
jgi:hypothetical protein